MPREEEAGDGGEIFSFREEIIGDDAEGRDDAADHDVVGGGIGAAMGGGVGREHGVRERHGGNEEEEENADDMDHGLAPISDKYVPGSIIQRNTEFALETR